MKTLLVALGVVLCAAAVPTTREEAAAKQHSVENGLRSKRMNILERMKSYQVPGVSVAVVNEGRVEWAQGYGQAAVGGAAVDAHTLFQAGSISKPVTAFGALILVQRGKISLDEDVNKYLKRWKVPENEFTKTEKVTLRRLLSHTAGTGVHGFPGYAVGTVVPTVVDVLEGKKPLVNTDPVTVVSKPGTEMKYSGGGTTIVQLLIEDVTGEPFDVWMQDNVLKPLGMSESTFKQPLPDSYAAHAAHGYHANGVAVEGKWHIYPEMGAAGLWSTPTDLARFVVAIQTALKDKEEGPLSVHYVNDMVMHQKIGDKEIDVGLGFFLSGQGADLIFYHGGEDEGFTASLTGYAFRRQGAIIMTNSDSPSVWSLIEEIANGIADTYHWHSWPQ
jgi:CubicO group peptidase (beta-lactamase class C family)